MLLIRGWEKHKGVTLVSRKFQSLYENGRAIGGNAVISLRAVVAKNVAANTVVGGVSVKFIKKI